MMALTRRGLLGYVAAGLAGAGLLPRIARADPWAGETSLTPPGPIWVRTSSADVSLRGGPDTGAERLRLVRSGTALRVVDDAVGGWKQVYDPHADVIGYVHADLLQPADAPARFAYLPEVPLEAELSTVIRSRKPPPWSKATAR
jgi:SH3-like domain-containing protein